jgi:hypothetical protein
LWQKKDQPSLEVQQGGVRGELGEVEEYFSNKQDQAIN